MMDKNHVLIFDFDGTIADTFGHLLKISNRLSAEFGFKKIEPHEVESLKNKNVQGIIRHLNIPLLKIPMIAAKARKELHKDIASVMPIKGLKEILRQLKVLKYKMGILTSNSSKNVMDFLKNNDLDFFDFVHPTSKIFSKGRILKALVHNNHFELSEVIYIGDETRDIDAAQKAGILSAAVTWGYNSHEALKARQPDYLIHSPQELFQLLKKNH